jgi:outer membrane receptor protein involved in Fe transport
MNIRNIALLGGVSLLALTSTAYAQEAAVDEVVVTGSRVITNSTMSPTPLTAVSAEQLRAVSATTIPDALNKLPVFQGSSTQRSFNNSSGNASGNVVSLRNFGAQRTLVLLDGHRVTPSSAAGTANVDVLPQMLLQRVDVVTGGASAVYGSDAITGVVNFILDKNYSGVKFDANAGIAQSGVGFNHQAGIAAGTSFAGGRGHIEGSLRYFASPEVKRLDTFAADQAWISVGNGTAANPFRDVANGRIATTTDGGKIVTCTPACPGALNWTFAANGQPRPFVAGAATGTNNAEIGGDGTWARVTTGLAKLNSNEAFLRASYDLTDDVNAYVNVSLSSSRNKNWHFTQSISFAGSNRYFWSNAFLPASVQALGPAGGFFTLNKFFANNDRDLSNAVKSITRFGQINAGLTGKFGNFDWDLFYTHGESHLTVFALANLDNEKVFAANDAVINPANGQIVCQVSLTAFASRFPGCQPLNPFGPTATSDEMLRYVTLDTVHRQLNILDNFGGSVAGELFALPAGPLRGAVTAEWRKTRYDVDSNFRPDQFVDCTGLRLCIANTPRYYQNTVMPVDVQQSVWEVSGELDVPLLADMPFVESLSLNLAGRHTDYSISGSVQTWKVGVDYHINPTVRFRGTTSLDIRAPTLTDLFQPPTQSATGYNDLHTSVAAVTQVVNQGNANLEPERARTWTGGIVLTPAFIPGFNFAVDYYRIGLKDGIGSLAAGNAQVANLCEASNGTGPTCALYERPLPFSNRTAANYPTRVFNLALNTASRTIRGFDVEMNYRFDVDQVLADVPGTLALRILANHQPNDKSVQFAGASPSYSITSKFRVTSTLSYTAGDWRFNITDRFLNKYDRRGNVTQFYENPIIPSFNQVDVQISRGFTAMGAEMNAYIQAENVFNADPPITGAGAGIIGYGQTTPAGYPVLGRTFAIGIRGNF